jgi:tyrosyl-tRNA synthetase
VRAPSILDDLARRGLLHDTTDRDELRSLLEGGPVGCYCGFDPTADSLHVGNLIGLLNLRRFQLAGHRPVVVAGGATGMIGDPSGRSDERNLLDADTLERNVAAISEQLRRFVDFTPGPTAAELLDNRLWTSPMTMVEFLRDVGKYFTVNQMVAKDSVRSRMESESGISYTEFSYMLLQANDFAWLAEHRDVVLQVGGSDQWGNIVAGIDLVRRRLGRSAHGLTWPLMTKADGTKFGKSQGGNIWLSAKRTSPYAFYQHWLQSDDRDVERFLLQLTLLPVDDVEGIVRAHAERPEAREAQRVLAKVITELVHGQEALDAASEASEVVFGGAGAAPSAAALSSLEDEIPTARLDRERLAAGITVVDLLVDAGVVASKGEARRLLAQSGVTIGDARATPEGAVDLRDLRHDRYLLVRKGKRHVTLVVVS